jgi:hypothetical protein
MSTEAVLMGWDIGCSSLTGELYLRIDYTTTGDDEPLLIFKAFGEDDFEQLLSLTSDIFNGVKEAQRKFKKFRASYEADRASEGLVVEV